MQSNMELFHKLSRSCAGSLLTLPLGSLCVKCVLGGGNIRLSSLCHTFCFSLQFSCAYSTRLLGE